VDFFTDRDLGAEVFPRILREAGLTVHRHVDHFRPDAPDEEWLPEAARRGWIVLSSDKAILHNPLERDAVMRSGAPLFVLIGGDAPAAALARNFVNTLPAVRRFLAEHAPPFIAKVYRPNPVSDIDRGRPGRVELKLSRDDWRRMQERM
jgi:PIN like domain